MNNKDKLRTKESIQTWLVAEVARQLAVDPREIDPGALFEDCGLDSLQALILAEKLEKQLEIELAPTLLAHYPTIEALAARLAAE